MLTGPLFMLQVYDRVLGSRSLATLVALVVIVAFLFLIMACWITRGGGYSPARCAASGAARLARVESHPRSLGFSCRTRPPGLRAFAIWRRSSDSPRVRGLSPSSTLRGRRVFLLVLFSFTGCLGFWRYSRVVCLRGSPCSTRREPRISSKMSGRRRSIRHLHRTDALGRRNVQGLGMQEAVVSRSAALAGHGSGQNDGGLGQKRLLQCVVQDAAVCFSSR